jgi:uncharacterized protein (DUF2147 family)
MIKNLILSAIFLLAFNVFSQDVLGVWATIDKETKKPSSHIKIYKAKNGRVFGKIVKILNPKTQHDVCTKCKGDRKGQPILNMVIISDLTKEGDEYKNGKVIDTRDGKIYNCSMWVENGDLKLRGYLGWFFSTDTWKPVN